VASNAAKNSRGSENVIQETFHNQIASAILWRPSILGVTALVNQQPSIKKRRLGTPGLWGLIAVGAIIAVVVLAILVDSALYYNKVHAGVSVNGIDLGGKTKTEAIATISSAVGQAQNSPITLTSGDKKWTLMPADVGASMDVEGAVKAAMEVSRKSNFIADLGTRWKLFFTKRDLPLTGSVDSVKMQTFVAGIAKELDVAPVNAGLSIENGQIKVINSVDGKVVDQTGLGTQLQALLVSLHSTSVEVPVVVKAPAVKAEDNAQAQQQAETMISGPVTIVSGTNSWTITPQQIASYMGFTSKDENGVSTLVPEMDVTKLQPLLDQITPAVAINPVSATFAADGTKAWVVPGKEGEQLDADATAQSITDATLKTGDRTVQVVTKKKDPNLTTQQATDRGITEVLGTYTTAYNCPTPRQINVKLCTKYATDVMLAPGQEYNFDQQIGPRTVARGWQMAPGITGPNQLEDVLGGGICQVSTTMFNAVGEAGLKITERHNHSLYINHYPKGRDATVTGGGKNLRFVNDTGHYIWIRGSSSGVKTTIIIYGTDDGRKGHVTWTVGAFYNQQAMGNITIADPSLLVGKTSIVTSGQAGKSLKTTRVVTRNGVVIHNDVWISVWPMYPQTVAVGTATTKPPTTTTTGPPTTTTTT
jgi:vancomycin resistance protein YoaR